MKKITIPLVSFLAMLICSTPVLADTQQIVSSGTEAAPTASAGTDGSTFAGDFVMSVSNGTAVNSDGANADAITTGVNNTGSVTFAGSSTVTGNVGTASSGLIRALSLGNSAVAGSNVVVNGDLNATTTTIHSGTLTLNGNLTGTTVNFASPTDGQLQVLGNRTIGAAITTDTANAGSVLVLGSSTFSGQIGTSSLKVGSVSGGATGQRVTFSSDVFAERTYVTQNGTLTFNGDVTSAVNFNGNGLVEFGNGSDLVGAITTSTDNTGSLIYNGASNITSAIGVVTTGDLNQAIMQGGVVTLNSGAAYAVTTTYVRTNTLAGTNGTLKLGRNSTITGVVRVTDDPAVAGSSAFDASTYVGTVTGAFEIASGAMLKTTVTTSSGTSTTAGLVSAVAGGASVSSSSLLDVNVQTNYVENGAVYMLVDGNGTAVGTPGTTTDNSATLTFTPSNNAANDLIMTVSRANLGAIVTDPNASAVGASLNTFTTGATGDMATVIANIDTLGSVQQVSDAFSQLDPGMNGGVNQASFNTTGGALNTVSNRLDNARLGINNGNGQTGMATGDEFADVGLWTQGFGGFADQDDKGAVSGYDASTWGVAGGFDWKVDERGRVGVSIAYGQSDVDTNDGLQTTDMDAYQGAVYGTYEGDPWYIDAMFAFGWNNYESARTIRFAGINRTADQEYDGQQYSTKWTFGYPLALADNWSLVPMISLLYSHLNLDGFTETGAGALNLTVDDQSYDLLQQGLGAKIVTEWTDDKSQKWMPSFHALWLYDYIGDEASSTARFTGGGTAFSTTGLEPEQSSLNAGAGLTVWPTESLSLGVNYDFEYRSDYTSHGGNATLRYEF